MADGVEASEVAKTVTTRDKVGMGIIVTILLLLGVAYYVSTERPENASGDFTNNPIVEHRMRTLDADR